MELQPSKTKTMINGPFKMKGWSPFTHKGIFARHPSKKSPPIGHTRADHPDMETKKKEEKAKEQAIKDTEFEKKYGVHPSKTRRYASGALINIETGEVINE